MFSPIGSSPTITTTKINPGLKSCLRDLSSLENSPSQEFNLCTKEVIFDDITVREYPQILGDNPMVTAGPPVTLAWNYQNEYTMDFNLYECSRSVEKRRSSGRLSISPKKRVESLISAGYGLEDIADAIINANKIKCQRMDSLRDWNGPLDFLSGAVETTGAAFKAMDVLGVGAATGKAVKGVGKNMSAAMGGMTRIAGSAIPALKKRSPSTPAC